MIPFAIVINFRPFRQDWLNNCLKSFEKYDKYPIFLVSSENGFNTFKRAFETIEAEEILILHDSCEVKDTSFIEECFEKHKGHGVSFSNHPTSFGMNMGKMVKKYALQAGIPNGLDGFTNSQTLEIDFNNRYCQLDTNFVQLWDDFVGSADINQGFEVKFGRNNMIVENKYLKKYKGHWSPQMYLDEIKSNSKPIECGIVKL